MAMFLEHDHKMKHLIMWRQIIAMILLLLLCIVNLQAQTFPENADDCLSPTTIDINHLPSNMRVIVDDGESQELRLFDPFSNSNIDLPDTTYIYPNSTGRSAIPLLYQDDERMFLHKGTSWQSMDIDGENTTSEKEILDRRHIVFNKDGQILFIDWDSDVAWANRQYQILDVTTGEITDFVFPELIDFVESTIVDDPTPVWWKVNPTFDYQAYDAWEDDVSESEDFNIVARVQKVPEGDYFDISSNMMNDLPLGVISWKSDYLLGILRYREGIEFIFDVLSQEQVIMLSTPREEWDFAMPSVLSPDRMYYAIRYITNENNVPNIIEVIDKQGNHVQCLQVERKPQEIRITNQSIHWTHDNRLLWWLECDSEMNNLGRCEGTYRLVMFDMETNQYGFLLSDVGINTRIGFIDN